MSGRTGCRKTEEKIVRAALDAGIMGGQFGKELAGQDKID
jgi:hypothetical protein